MADLTPEEIAEVLAAQKEQNKLNKESYEQRMAYHKLQKEILAAQGKEAEMVKEIGAAYEEYMKKSIDGFVDLKSATAEQQEQIKQKTADFQKLMGLEGQNIDEIIEKFKQMDRVFDSGTKAADKFGGSLANKLGMASHHSETFIGKMQELNKTLADPKARQAFTQRIKEIFTFTNMASSLLQKIAESTLAFAFGVDNATAKFAAATGAGRAYTDQIRTVGGEMMQFGVTAEDAGKSMTALYSKFPGFINLTKENQVELGKNVAALEKLGVSADESAQLFGSLTKTFKVTSKEATKMVKDLAFGAKAIGVPVSTMIKGFKEANKYLATYGKSSVKVFKQIAASAQAAGVEISDVLALSKKFDTFSSSAETAAKMNAVFGTSMSALGLVTMDVQDRIPYLVEQFKATGKEFGEMDRYSQLAAAQILGFGDDVEKAGKVLSMSTTEFGKYNEEQKKAAEQQKEYDQLLKDTMPVMMKFKMAFMKLATVLVPLTEHMNSFAQGVMDFAVKVRDHWGKALIVFGLVGIAIMLLGAKIAGAAIGAAIPIGALAGAMGGLATALGSISVTGVPAGASITVVGNAAAGSATRMAPLIAAVGLAAVGIGVMAYGVADLVRAFGEFPGAIGPVLITLGALTVMLIVLGAVGMKLGIGMLAAGFAMLMFGTGVGIAAAGMSMLVEAFGGAIASLLVFNQIGFDTIGKIYLMATAITVLAASMALLSFGIPAMLALSGVLVAMGYVADRVAAVTENLAAIATGSVTSAFVAISEALSELDQGLSGNVELRATIEDLALISTGQSSNTISKGVDTTSAIQNAFKGLEKVFKPQINLTVELDGKELDAKIKKTTSKTD